MFGVISTSFVTHMKNSTLINDEKYLLDIKFYMQNQKSIHATGDITTYS